MRTFFEAIDRHTPQAAALKKHLTAVGIHDWNDLTKVNIEDLKDYLSDNVAPSSERTYLASIKAVMTRYEDEVAIPCRDFRTVLRSKNDKPVKTYLDVKELEMLEAVPVKSAIEQFVKDEFLIGAYTGMRISDIKAVTIENIEDNILSYVSIKTGIHASLPCKKAVFERIQRVRSEEVALSLTSYNKAIRRLCQRAGINKKVKVRKGGRDLVGEKWEFISSHSARISFATIMANFNVPLLQISAMCGHTNTQMTERYIVNKKINLPASAQTFFK